MLAWKIKSVNGGRTDESSWSHVEDDIQHDWELISEDADGDARVERDASLVGGGRASVGNVEAVVEGSIKETKGTVAVGSPEAKCSGNVLSSCAETNTDPKRTVATQAVSTDDAKSIDKIAATKGIPVVKACPPDEHCRGNIFSSCAKKSTDAFIAAMDEIFCPEQRAVTAAAKRR